MSPNTVFLSLHWQDIKSTGIPELDDHHQEFVNKTNALLVAVSEGKQNKNLMEILLFARKYAKKHFTREEEYMEKYQCPAAEKNRQEHAAFIERFDAIIDDFVRYGETEPLVAQVMNEMSGWFTDHISSVDAELARYVPAV